MPRFDIHAIAVSLVVGVLATTATAAAAQSLDSLAPTTRVRVDFPTGERSRFHRDRAQSVIGTLEGVRGDTLLLAVRPGAVPLRVPRATIHRVYVSRGRPPRWRAALEGALLPAVITGALSAAGASIHRKAGDPSPGDMAASSAAWAAASGALLNAWSPKERWRVIR